VELDTIPNALVVPRDAVNDGPDSSYVYVVTNGKAVQRNVRVLFDDAKTVAIEGDVNPGDSVIVEGQLRVDPNGTVNVLGLAGGSQAGPNITPAGIGARP
jgi:multidrug efflux system membrane fusion protein